MQTFTWEGQPDEVALETIEFTRLADGTTRLHARSLCDSFATRDAMLRGNMSTGINEGYEALERMLTHGTA